MPLKLQVVSADPLDTKADVVVLGVFEDEIPASLHRAFGGGLKDLVAREEFTGKKDQKLALPTLGRLPAARLVLLGLGKRGALPSAAIRLFGATAAKQADRAESLAVAAPDGLPDAEYRSLAEGLVLGAYRFSKYLTGDRRPKKELHKIVVLAPGKKPAAAAQKAAALGVAIGEAIGLTRDLQNEPPNELTPEALANAAVKMSEKAGLKVTVMDFKKLQSAGMKLIVAVGQGSANKPRLVHMTYSPAKKAKRRIVFVGKGLTFDSGGLCIKPAQGMGDMKTDMSGAANVVGLMAAVAAIAPPDVEVHGIIGCAENMPDGEAYRPGDIFGSLDGKTVEIINTDAEGRLVLADCLTYACRLSPDLIVDNATLTGACVVALGNNCSGYYATSDELAQSFGKAARDAGEQFWQLPLLEDLKEQLKSDCADLKHTGERFGGSITAALFLREFVDPKIPWIHCDIAGPSLSSRAYGIYPKGGTGHGVLTFLSLLSSGAWGAKLRGSAPRDAFMADLAALPEDDEEGTATARSLPDVLAVATSPILLTGVYAWVITLSPSVGLVLAQLGRSGVSSRAAVGAVAAVLALVPLLLGSFLAHRDSPRAPQVGIWGFVLLSLASWVLLPATIEPGRLDALRGCLGAAGFTLYALAWGVPHVFRRLAPEDDPRADTTIPLEPRDRLPRAALVVGAVGVLAGATYFFFAFRVTDAARGLFAQSLAGLAAVAVVSAAAQVAVGRGVYQPPSPRSRLRRATRALFLLGLLVVVALAQSILSRLRSVDRPPRRDARLATQARDFADEAHSSA